MILAVCAGALVDAALAADDLPRPQLPALDVTAVAPASGMTVPRNQLPYAVQSGNAATLAETQSGSVAEFLARYLTGVNVSDIQGNRYLTDLTYRGFRASSIIGAAQGVSVYLDGVRINEPFGDIVGWDLVPEAALATVTLIPGSDPLYGLNTLGGALALATKSGLSDPGVSADLRFGSFSRKRADVALGTRDEDGWHAFAAATYFTEDGWREHSDGHLANGFARLGRAAGHDDFDFTLLYAQSTLNGNGLTPGERFVADGTVPALYAEDPRAVYTWSDTTRSRVTQGTLRFMHAYDAGPELAALAYFRNSDRSTANGDVAAPYADYVDACGAGFRQDGQPVDPVRCTYSRAQGAALDPAVLNTTQTSQRAQGAALTLSMAVGGHRAVAGATLDRATVSYGQYAQAGTFTDGRQAVAAPGAPVNFYSGVDGTNRTWSLFGTDTFTPMPGTHLTGSLRFNASRVSSALSTAADGALPAATFTYTKLNPALGLAQQLDAAVVLFGGFSQSNRVPTVIELGCADPAAPCRLPAGLQSDPYLNQVVAQTLEGGVRYAPGANGALDVSLYRTRNRDDIVFLRAPDTQQGYFANFGATLHRGVDVGWRQRFGPLRVRAAYSYLDATYDAPGTLASGERTIRIAPGTRIPGLPRNTVKLDFAWQPVDAVDLGVNVVAVSSVTTLGNEDGLVADPVSGEPLPRADAAVPGYAVVNVRGAWRAERDVEFYGNVSNVLDRRYATYGALGQDVFPGGTLARPQVAPTDAGTARFVAPGSGRAYVVGLRYRF